MRRVVDLFSPAIGASGTVIAYGHWGRPVLVFPSEDGRAGDFEANGMVDAVTDLLEEHERLEHLRALLEVGRQDELRGDLVTVTPELFEEIDRRVEERFLRGDEPNPDVCP